MCFPTGGGGGTGVRGETMSAVLLLPTHACANRVHGHVTVPLYLQPLTTHYSLYFSASLGRPPRCLSRSNNCLDCRLSMSSAVFVAPLFSPLHSLAQTFNCEYFSAGQECTLTYFFLPSASGKSWRDLTRQAGARLELLNFVFKMSAFREREKKTTGWIAMKRKMNLSTTQFKGLLNPHHVRSPKCRDDFLLWGDCNDLMKKLFSLIVCMQLFIVARQVTCH